VQLRAGPTGGEVQAGGGLVVAAEDVDAELLAQLPSKSLGLQLARLNVPSGQSPSAGVGATLRAAESEEHPTSRDEDSSDHGMHQRSQAGDPDITYRWQARPRAQRGKVGVPSDERAAEDFCGSLADSVLSYGPRSGLPWS